MKRFFLKIISFIFVLGIGSSGMSLAEPKAETNGETFLRSSAVRHNSDIIKEVKGKLGADEIEEQAQKIAEGNIEGLTFDKSGKVVGNTESLRKLKLKLGEIFAAECKKKTAEGKARELLEFWELVEKNKDFLEEIGQELLTNRIRMGMTRPPRTFPKEMLVKLAVSGIESYAEEEGALIKDGKIKHSAKEVILGSLQPWQHTLKNRLVLRDRFIVEEMAGRGNEGVVMDIGIAAGISSYWYVPKSLRLFQNKEDILPGVTFIDLADKLAGHTKIKLIGVDIETAGLKDLLKNMREGKTDEALKGKYLNSKINYLCCDLADKLPVRNESIDIISVADVFPYILRDELRIEALSNICQALKEGGVLVFVEPRPLDKVAHGKTMTTGTIEEKRISIAKAFSDLDYEIYRKEKQKLVYQGRLSWDEAKEVELKKGDETPQLAKYLNILGDTAYPHLVVLGMTHKTSSIEARNKFSFPKEKIPSYLKMLKEKEGIKEAMILKTCHRREIYVVVDNIEETKQILYNFLYSFFPQETNKQDLKKQVFVKSDKKALAHLFLVTCGLDALAIGETQIISQVKNAYEAAKKEKDAGEVLEKVFSQAIKVNHIIRSRFPGISRGDISISSLAVKKAKNILGDFKGKICLLVGAGEVQHETWEHLQGRGLKEVIIVSKNIESAQALAKHIREEHTDADSAVKTETVSYAEKEKSVALFKKADIVLTATDFPHKPLIGRGFVEKVMKERKNEPLVFIDMGDPGDVAREVNGIEGVSHFSLDELQDVVENHQKVVTEGSSIINDEADKRWQKFVKKEEIPLALSFLKEVGNVWGKWQKYYLDDYHSRLLSKQAKQYLEKTLNSFTNKYLGALRKNLSEIEPSLQKEAIKYLSLFWREKDAGKDFSHYSLSQPVILNLKREWAEIFHQEMLAIHTDILSFSPQEQKFIHEAGDNLIYSLLACADKALTEVGGHNRKEAEKYARRFLKQRPLEDKYLHIPLWARAAFPSLSAERSPQELDELGDLNKQRAIILNEELFKDNPGAGFHIIDTNRQMAKEKGLKFVLALSAPDNANIFYEAIKEASDGEVDLNGQFDYVVSAKKTAMAVVKKVQKRFPNVESIEIIGPEEWAREFGGIRAGKGVDAKECIVIICGLGKGNYITNSAGAFDAGLKALLFDTEILSSEEREKIDRLKDKKTGFFVIEAKRVGNETQAIIRNYRETLASK